MDEYIKAIVEQNAKQQETVAKQQEQMLKQQEQIASLCQALKNKDPLQVNVAHAPRNAAEVRAEKIQQLTLNLRKSNRIKLYKPETDINVYLRKFKEEIQTLKHMVGIANDLDCDE